MSIKQDLWFERFAGTLRKLALLIFKTITERFLVHQSPAITVSTLRGWRYPVFLMNALTSASVVGIHWRDVGAAFDMLSLGQFVFRVRIASFMPRTTRGVLLHDRNFGRNIRCERTVSLETNYYSHARGIDSYIVPYFAHPRFYDQETQRYTRGLSVRSEVRARPRELRLFFSGTVSERHYSAAGTFSILTRPEILACLQQALNEPALLDLRKRSSIVLVEDIEDRLSKHSMSLAEFLRTLSESDFFLCPPGFRMPHSHNLIEAMSVGAIPITNYAHLMSPPLRHGVDCLAFSTLDELEGLLTYVMNIDKQPLERLRHGVRSYYSCYLEPFAVGDSLIERLGNISRVVVNDESGL